MEGANTFSKYTYHGIWLLCKSCICLGYSMEITKSSDTIVVNDEITITLDQTFT